jgi:phosphohistidine phosphatase
MKRLLLLRHASAGGGAPGLTDFERPLTEQGREEATLMGKHLQTIGSLPDSIIASPARRAKETAEIVAQAVGNTPALSFERRLYEAPTEAILQTAQAVRGDPEILLLVGHNPSMQLAALNFAGETALGAELLRSYPAAGLASFTFGKDNWRDISWSDAALNAFVSPRVLAADHSAS